MKHWLVTLAGWVICTCATLSGTVHAAEIATLTVAVVSVFTASAVFGLAAKFPEMFVPVPRPVVDAAGGEAARTYHNEKIYENFKLFITLQMAMIGGMGFLLTREAKQPLPVLSSDVMMGSPIAGCSRLVSSARSAVGSQMPMRIFVSPARERSRR